MMNPILEHHYRNIVDNKAVKDGKQLQTVFTSIVEIDGRETLIPTVWDGKVLGTEEAVQRSIDSGISWPSIDSNNPNAISDLEKLDIDIHKQIKPVSIEAARKALGIKMKDKQKSSIEMGNIEFHQTLMEKDNYDPIVALGFDPSVAHSVPDLEATNFLLAGQYIPFRDNTPRVAGRIGNQQEKGGMYRDVFSGEDLVMTYGPFANKSAVWNHEFRHRGLQILRNNFSDEEIVENMPIGIMEHFKQLFGRRTPNKDISASVLLDAMNTKGGDEWLMNTYDGLSSPDTDQTQVGSLLDDRGVNDLMTSLNGLARRHMDRINEERYENTLRERGTKKPLPFESTSDATSGGSDAMLMESSDKQAFEETILN